MMSKTSCEISRLTAEFPFKPVTAENVCCYVLRIVTDKYLKWKWARAERLYLKAELRYSATLRSVNLATCTKPLPNMSDNFV